jgi:hypothetical protein
LPKIQKHRSEDSTGTYTLEALGSPTQKASLPLHGNLEVVVANVKKLANPQGCYELACVLRVAILRELNELRSSLIAGSTVRNGRVHHLHVNFVARSYNVCGSGSAAQDWSSWAEFWKTMQIIERRTQRRLALRWPVRLSRDGIGTVEGWTKNLSASSFYCIVDNPFPPGERIDCGLIVPGRGGRNPASIGSIQCQAEVIRVEALGAGQGFGIACRIIDFNFSHK